MSVPHRKTACTIWLCLFAFLLNVSYSIARPATESLFLGAHGSRQLPWVWLLVAACMAGSVSAYNRVLTGRNLVRLFGGVSLVSGLVLIGLQLLLRARFPGSYYLLYAWKDIYMVVLVEIFYSFANAIFPIRSARWFYGLFGAVGAGGGVLGNLTGGWLAASGRLGTVDTLWVVLVPLGLLWLTSALFSRQVQPLASRRPEGSAAAERPMHIGQAFRVVRTSRYLLLVLGAVALAQVIVTAVDFEYNRVLESVYPDTDVRTGITGKIYALVQALTALLHLLSGPILRLAGAPLVLLALPVLLAGGLSAFALVPGFVTVGIVKVASKVFDYTLFRNAKELLYIPLSYAQITRGKSIVDMFIYRNAKVGASLLLLGLIAAGAAFLVVPLIVVLLAGWTLVLALAVRRFRGKVSRDEEMRSA